MKRLLFLISFIGMFLLMPFSAKAEDGDYIIHIKFYNVNTGETVLLPEANGEYYLHDGQEVIIDNVNTKEYYDSIQKILIYDSNEHLPSKMRIKAESIVGWKLVDDVIDLRWVSNDGAVEMAAPEIGLIPDTSISSVSISASIEGRVESGIEMVLRREGESQELQTVYTDENGVAIFEDVEMDTYSVYCEEVNQGWYISDDMRGVVHARFSPYYKLSYYFYIKEINNFNGDLFEYNLIKRDDQKEDVISTLNSNSKQINLSYTKEEKENYYLSQINLPEKYTGEAFENYLITPYINQIYIYSTVSIPKLKPGKPVITMSTKTSTGENIVSWKEVSNGEKYQVYRATSEEGTYNRMATTKKLYYTDTNATVGKRYYYKVRAISSDGTQGTFSSIKSRVCDCAQPVVTMSNVASTGKNKVTWKKVTGATSYKVYRATSKTGTYSLVKTTTGISYIDTKATVGKKYYYKVKAYSSKSSSATSVYSAIKSRTCDLKRPTVKIALSSKKPKLTWGKVTGATSYKVYRATSKTGTYSLKKTITTLSYRDATAKSGKTYYYKVVAVSSKTSAANSAYSTVKSIKSK